jgi:HD-GYP domain-containing protein (c-di-GMP phosphodiesterase class II)
VKRAALLHDLGLVAAPSFFMNRPEHSLGLKERETLRLHPYHGERILSGVRAMLPYASPIGAHHERFDGLGYFRGLKGKDIPLAARIVAVADRLDELTHERPGHPAQTLSQAVESLIADSGSAYDPDIVFCVAGSLGVAEQPPQVRVWPARLTDREVDVVRLASKGLTRQQIGESLRISENTVRHHLTHIYEKTGTTTRVGATLFAMETGLID